MRYLGRFFSWLERRIKNPVLIKATSLAYSTVTDEEAAGRLRPVALSDPRRAHQAVELLERRNDFRRDRAYRLLVAATEGELVQPILEEHRELFLAEERLGRMPLEEAFAFFAEQHPELRDLEAAAKGEGQLPAGPAVRKHTVPSELVGWVLSDCHRGSDELSDSGLARAVTSEYLRILEGARDGNVSESYFALPRKRVVVVTHFRRTP